MQAWRRKPEGEARSVAATWSGVVWPWFLRPASAIEWLRTLAASGVRVCWMVLSPALISRLERIEWCTVGEAPAKKKKKKNIEKILGFGWD